MDKFVIEAKQEHDKLEQSFPKATKKSIEAYEAMIMQAHELCTNENKTNDVHVADLVCAMEKHLGNKVIRKLYINIVNSPYYALNTHQRRFFKMDHKDILCVHYGSPDLNQDETFHFIGNPDIQVKTSISKLNDMDIPVDSIFDQECNCFMTRFHLKLDRS